MHEPNYNHKVRLAVSDKYVELGKLRQEVVTKLMRVTESLKNDMPVSQYKCLQQEKNEDISRLYMKLIFNVMF